MGREAIAVGNVSKAIAAILDEARIKRGLSYTDLERRSQIGWKTISRILQQKRAISVDELNGLSEALGLRASEVYCKAELVLDPTLTYPTYTLAADNQWRDPELEAYGAQESP